MSEYQYGLKYKFKSLEFFVSEEWMIDSKRKYRSVFDKKEMDYLFFELKVYNKLFDEEDWDAEFRFVVRDLKKDEQICDLKREVKVTKDKNIVT